MSVECNGRFFRISVIQWIVRRAVWGLLLCSCMSAVAADRLVVYAVNYPLAYFAERIGGGHVEVHFPAPAAVDPAFWMPDADTVAGYQGADLILLNGAGYAKWIERVSLPRRKLVDTSRGFAGSYITVTEGVTHQHGPDGDHAHTGIAFTTWLDFSQAAQQAGEIAAALSRQRPEHAAAFNENLQRLQEELLQLDARMQALAAAQPGLPLLASHPVYQYLARRYGLQLRAVTWEPAVQPDGSSWRELQSMLETQASHWMLWEDDPRMETRAALERLGVQTVLFRPGMNRPATGDFMTLMQANIKALAVAFHAPD
jgi:zinc transport system substrate-binding protein